MPVTSAIIDGIIYTEMSGEINYDHVIMHVDFLVTLKDTIVNRYELHDHSNTENISLTADDILKIAKYSIKAENIFKHTFLAIYAPTDLSFGIARMSETFYALEKHSMVSKIFNDREKAIQFLMEQKRKYG